jgi:hypothetical protein
LEPVEPVSEHRVPKQEMDSTRYSVVSPQSAGAAVVQGLLDHILVKMAARGADQVTTVQHKESVLLDKVLMAAPRSHQAHTIRRVAVAVLASVD